MAFLDIGSGASTGQMFGAAADLFQGIGTAASDFSLASADKQSAALYGQEAGIAQQDIALAAESGRLQELQERRNVNLTVGQEAAAVGANGFTLGGSGMDIVKASQMQGAITQGITSIQTAIQEQGYETQEVSALAEQQQAQSAASRAQTSGFGAILGGVLKAAPVALAML